jgi:hypothetical protein
MVPIYAVTYFAESYCMIAMIPVLRQARCDSFFGAGEEDRVVVRQ